MGVSYLKKIRLMRSYLKTIRNNRLELSELNLRVDNAGRIYTVLKLPEESEVYGVDIAKEKITEFINKVDNLLLKLNLKEMVGIRDIKTLEDNNYLLVFGFSLINTPKFFTNLIIYSGITLIALITLLIIFI